DSYSNGKAYYDYSSYPCERFYNPETNCKAGVSNGISDIFFKFEISESFSGSESLVNSINPGSFFADMNDDFIVATDNGGGLSNGISAYNISTGQNIRITQDKYIRPNPVISGHKIVWGESENSNTWAQAIFIYDLDLGTSTQIIPAEQGISSLDFDGKYIVWSDYSGFGSQIYFYDLSTSNLTIIDKDDSDKQQDVVGNAKISGGKILYSWSWICGMWCSEGELRLYDIATGEKTVITAYGGWYPVTDYEIDGDNIIIAWKADLYNGQNIYRHKISAKESNFIFSSSSGIYGFSVSDNILAWSDSYDIFIYDLVTGKTGRAGIEPKASVYPKVFGNAIVWWDYRAVTNVEFYMYQLVSQTQPPEPEKWSFAVITDLHIGRGYPDYGGTGFEDSGSGEDYYLTDRLKNVVNWVNENKNEVDCGETKCPIQFLAVLGDITEAAEKSEFCKVKEILDNLEVPYIPVFGNHDVWPYAEKEADYSKGEEFFDQVFWNDTPSCQNATSSKNFKVIQNLFSFKRDEANPKYKNFAFSFKEMNFIGLDFNSRTHIHVPGFKIGVMADANDWDETTNWLKDCLENHEKCLKGYEKNSNIIFSHHPFIGDRINA
ncbi:MAG: metallophosphoesterase, partial [Minisyncoccia bacterium]